MKEESNEKSLREQVEDIFKNYGDRLHIHVTHDRFGMRNVAAIFVDGQAVKETVCDVTEEVNDAVENYSEMYEPQIY